jgi:hypothetical protein
MLLKNLEKQKQTKPKISRMKEITKMRNKWNWSIWKPISKIDKTLARLIKKKAQLTMKRCFNQYYKNQMIIVIIIKKYIVDP